MSVFLYADDIILYAPSVTSLQQLLLVCEHELYSLDMAVNVKKSSCMKIGPRFNVDCCNIITEDCRDLLWCDSLRYLGVYINSARTFSCSYCEDFPKRGQLVANL